MDDKPPMVRKEWLIAMAIVGITLLALVWVFLGTSTTAP
jgi:type II secretory pathway pseudopilin PulG